MEKNCFDNGSSKRKTQKSAFLPFFFVPLNGSLVDRLYPLQAKSTQLWKYIADILEDHQVRYSLDYRLQGG